MKPDLDELEAAEKAMTPAPWKTYGRYTAGREEDDELAAFQNAGDTTGIVALRNSAPALFAETAGLRKLCGNEAGKLQSSISDNYDVPLAVGDVAERLWAASKGGETP